MTGMVRKNDAKPTSNSIRNEPTRIKNTMKIKTFKQSISLLLSIMLISLLLLSCAPSLGESFESLEKSSHTSSADVSNESNGSIYVFSSEPDAEDSSSYSFNESQMDGSKESFSSNGYSSSLSSNSNKSESVDSVNSSSLTISNNIITSESSPSQGNEPPKDIETPTIINTKYSTSDIVIADFIVTNSAYNADPTGQAESGLAIQRAIDDCYFSGGGTVWVPEGKYLVSQNIKIKPFVTLRGDWQDPDNGNSYGTIILANVSSSTADIPGLFTIAGSAGVMGLTIYYPEQNIDNVKPYPYTFYIPGDSGGLGHYMLQSIVNCTVINGYKGVGACISGGVHEMLTVENLKGTFLHRGVTAYNQADVGTWKNVKFSNEYWANAGNGLEKASREKIDQYTLTNGIGMVLGDLEWTQFSNISIADYKVGVNVVKGKRIEFAGSFLDLNIQRCDVGLKVDSIDTRWGMLVARGLIEGKNNAIVNATSGTIKMTGVTINGKVSGSNVIRDATNLDQIDVNYTKGQAKLSARLFNVVKSYGADNTGKTDTSVAIQKALTEAGSKGGGIVYLPAGQYRVDKPLSVPAKVEIRGSSSVANRDQPALTLGTIILAYYGENSSNPDDGTALITLNGIESGVNGFRIIYPENGPVNKTIKKYTYAIRGNAKGVYAVNMSISASYNGIDFRDCDGHFIKKLVSCSYNNSIFVGKSSGGYIEGCLQNGTVISRNGLGISGWLSENQLFTHLFDPITRKTSTFLKLDGANNQTVFNVFSYGVKTLIDNKNSTGVNILNIGADNIGKSTPLLSTSEGSLKVVNMMRYNGISYTNNKTNLKIYNRISILVKNEGNIS